MSDYVDDEVIEDVTHSAEDFAGLDGPTRAFVRKLRRENFNIRTRLRAAEARAAEADQLRAQIRDLQIDQALLGTCSDFQAKPRLIKALLHAAGILERLDPEAADFAESLRIGVEEVIVHNPDLGTLPLRDEPAARSKPEPRITPLSRR